ncbi:hypothetical protein EDB19DRAFT_2031390 [Suillus lakei]|nr:hypothetical protein EDB19DRAFT_2031390 [Suillus lakei]
MPPVRNYVCSAEAGCNQTFTRFTDLKKHEAGHSANSYTCTWPQCDFVTLTKCSFDIHWAKHNNNFSTGEQRHSCPHNCDYKTHNPAALTRHRKVEHGYIPLPRGLRRSSRGATPSTSASDRIPSSSSSSSQPQPSASSYGSHLGVLYGGPAVPAQQNHTMYTGLARAANGWQPPASSSSHQSHSHSHDPSSGNFYGRPPVLPQDYTTYTGPVRVVNGWQPSAPPPSYQSHSHSRDLSLGDFYGRPADISDDYMYTGPARGTNEWQPDAQLTPNYF